MVCKGTTYFFENLWKKAIPAKQRFRKIDLSLRREFIETLRDPEEIVEIIPKIITFSSKELLCIIPSFSFLQKFHVLKILRNHLSNYNLDYRILVNNRDSDKSNKNIVNINHLSILLDN